MSLVDLANQDGRSWHRIGDCYAVTRKPRDLDVHAHATIPFIPMESVPQGGSYEPSFTLKDTSTLTSGTYFERGDVLVAKITPSFENGKQALVRSLPRTFGYASTEVIPLHPLDTKHDPRLLFFYLLHPDIRHYVAERMEGSTGRQRVPEDVLLDLLMPNIEEKNQTQIADSLELIRTAITAEDAASQNARQLKQAAMRELFTRGLRDEAQKETEIGLMPASWEPRTILELCEISSGGTPRKSVAEYWSGDIPWVSGKDLKLPALDDTIDHISVAGVEAASRLAPQGAVLLLVRGMGLAKDLPVAVINRPMAFNQDVKALVSRGEYSGQLLRSAIYAGKERLLSQIVPSAHGTMTLNLNDVETFKVACPSDPDEATEIVCILDALDRKIDLHKQKRVVLEELFQSLLHKLMTGEIRVSELDLSALSTEVAG
jgi:type I restriction enzyme S subunit